MKIIYISGIDGCGKTTQSIKLVEWLNASGKVSEYQWFRWEPSIRLIIKRLRKAFKLVENNQGKEHQTSIEIEDTGHNDWSRIKKIILSARLFRWLWIQYATRDYSRAYRKIYNEWQSEYIVMDRYVFDFLVDQSINFDQSVQETYTEIKNTPFIEMRQPDLSIFIDIPYELGYKRKMDGTPLSYLKDRESYYGNAPITDNTLHVDGTNSVEQIHAQICAWVKPRLELNE